MLLYIAAGIEPIKINLLFEVDGPKYLKRKMLLPLFIALNRTGPLIALITADGGQPPGRRMKGIPGFFTERREKFSVIAGILARGFVPPAKAPESRRAW